MKKIFLAIMAMILLGIATPTNVEAKKCQKIVYTYLCELCEDSEGNVYIVRKIKLLDREVIWVDC